MKKTIFAAPLFVWLLMTTKTLTDYGLFHSVGNLYGYETFEKCDAARTSMEKSDPSQIGHLFCEEHGGDLK